MEFSTLLYAKSIFWIFLYTIIHRNLYQVVCGTFYENTAQNFKYIEKCTMTFLAIFVYKFSVQMYTKKISWYIILQTQLDQISVNSNNRKPNPVTIVLFPFSFAYQHLAIFIFVVAGIIPSSDPFVCNCFLLLVTRFLDLTLCRVSVKFLAILWTTTVLSCVTCPFSKECLLRHWTRG